MNTRDKTLLGVDVANSKPDRALQLPDGRRLNIGAMMRKLLHVAFGVLTSGKTFDLELHGATVSMSPWGCGISP